MEIIDQYGLHFEYPPKKIRKASRGLIVNNGKILLTYEKNTDVYMSPGGGREAGETFEECCIRELKEESGYDIIPVEPFLIINEYCFDTCYEAHYFLCEIKGKGEQNLTDIEIEHGAVSVWLDIYDALKIFSCYGAKSEDIMSLYHREYTVLNKYLELKYPERKSLIKSFLGQTVKIIMDRPKGYVHNKDSYSLLYPINYGYIPEVFGGDGEELDVYLLGVDEPIKETEARIIGIVHRHNDNEDKLVAAPDGTKFSKEDIEKAVNFQEKYYEYHIETADEYINN